MLTARPVDESVFDSDREAVFERIRDESAIYRIQSSTDADDWIIGPATLLSTVFGMIDEEYGWPVLTAANAALADLRPGPRRHPVIKMNDGHEVMSVGLADFHMLREATDR